MNKFIKISHAVPEPSYFTESKHGPILVRDWTTPMGDRVIRVDALYNLEATESFIDHSKSRYLMAFILDDAKHTSEGAIADIENAFDEIIEFSS